MGWIGGALAALALGPASAWASTTVRGTPINGELRLADVRVETPADARRVVLDTEGSAFEMDRFGIVDGRAVWKARVMGGPSSSKQLAVDVTVERVNGDRETVETVIDTDPPEAERVPAWALGAVWYQIFPERYRNGNPGNDPRGSGLYPMPWNAPWEPITIAELETGRAGAVAGRYELAPDQHGGMRFNLVWHRRFGGDLQGVEETLGHLSALGVTGIYLCPVFDAASMHKYDARDFRHIDPTLGDPGSGPPARPEFSDPGDRSSWAWTPADRYFVDRFLPACRAAGLRVMLDGVWNHTGREFWGFEDLVERGAESPFREWFEVRFDDDGRLASWEAWDRQNGYLPRFRRVRNGDLTPPVKRHIFEVTRRWMDPNDDGDPSDGIDGWRLDVAAEIAMPFWLDWRRLVRSINPDAITVGEIWHDAGDWFGGKAFDAQMNYPWAYPATQWLGAGEGPMTSEELGAAMADVFDHAPQNDLAQMNLLDSHDVERIVSMLWNPGRGYDRDAQRHHPGAEDYRIGPPPERAFALARLGAAFQATCLGAPMIYNGAEWGMHGADDPDNRRATAWPDRGPYAQGEQPRADMLAWYRAWFGLRSEAVVGPVLRYGSMRWLETGEARVAAFERALHGARVRVVLNAGEAPFDAGAVLTGGGGVDGWVQVLGPGGTDGNRAVVPPLQAMVWRQAR